MNWLSQMIHTEINLDRMYPAERPRQAKEASVDNLEEANAQRSNRARERIFRAIGDDQITAGQLYDRLKAGGERVKNAAAVRKLLATMLAEGLVTKEVPANHKGVLWGVVND